MPKNTDMTQWLMKGERRKKDDLLLTKTFQHSWSVFFFRLSFFHFPSFFPFLLLNFFGFFGSLYLQLFIIILLICCLPRVTTIITIITRAAIAKGKSKKGAPESRQPRLPTKKFHSTKTLPSKFKCPKKTCSNNSSDWGKNNSRIKCY